VRLAGSTVKNNTPHTKKKKKKAERIVGTLLSWMGKKGEKEYAMQMEPLGKEVSIPRLAMADAQIAKVPQNFD